MRTSLFAAALLLCASAASAQGRDFSKVEIQTVPVRDGVFMLEGAGGNIGVLAGPEGLLIVDDQFAPLAPKIEAALAKLGKAPLRFVLNTHWHGDHVGGNIYFGQKAPIFAHENVRVRMAKGMDARAGLPVVTYADGISLHLNDEEVRVFHLGKAHTDGDSVVHFTRAKVVHLGDQMFNGRFPFIDLASGGSVKGLIANLEALRPTLPPDVKIIPGHGPLATLKEYDAYLAMLKDSVARIEKGLRAGKKAAQLQKENVLEGYEAWSHDFIPTDRYIETVYRELAGPSGG